MELINRDAAIDALDTIHYTDREDWWAVLSTVENLPTASKHDEFEKALVDMFAPIMECEIDHPKYEDTVADIIRDVLKAYDALHPAERKDNG